jgi:hypothetical protein
MTRMLPAWPGAGATDPAAAAPSSCADTPLVAVSADWLRLARLMSWLTLAWMGIEGGVAIGAAIITGSVALLGFGLDSGIEAMASVIVIWRFTGTRLASGSGADGEGEFEEDLLDVGLDGALGDEQAVGDGPVGQPFGDEREHLAFRSPELVERAA